MSNRPIASHDTPDPWLIPSPLHPGIFYLTFTLGNRIEIWSSDNLESFHDHHPALRKTTVWQPPPGSPWSADIWAPELHFLFGTWWIYAAGAPPSEGNKGHRTIVLRCTDPNRDPMNGGSWVFEGPLRGLPNHQWSIDATVFSPDPGPNMPGGRPDEQRRWYVCYSGWPLGDYSDTQQDLFLLRMRNPLEADESSLTCISRAELPWERPDGGRRGVNEGPTWVSFQDGQWKGIVYSAHGSWTAEYKLGLLQFIGGPSDDLCNAASWRKRPTPLLVSDKDMGGPFGPGHASFISNPGDGRLFCIYHGTEKDNEGWNNRKGRVLCMGPEVFHDNGRTMCCAYSMCGPVGDTHGVVPGAPGGGHGQSQGQGQAQSWQQQQQQHQYQSPPNQNMPVHNQSWQGQSGQNYNQNWQGQQQAQQSFAPPPSGSQPPQSFLPPPPHSSGQQPQAQYPGSQAPNYSYTGQQQQQQQQQQQPQAPPLSQYPSHHSQSSSPYPGQQQQHYQSPPQQHQQFQPPPQQQQQQYQPPPQQQGYPPPSQQMYPGQPSQANQYGQQQPYGSAPGQGQGQGQGQAGSSFDKYTNEIQKRIPAQYQGYFNKAKKFLK